MASPTSPFTDHAAPILAGDPTLSDDQRANLHDAFHTKNAAELIQHLMPLTHVTDDTKNALLTAKQNSMPVPEPMEKASAAITHLAQMDPQVLATAEAHPNVLKALIGAATAPEKGSREPAGASKADSKGDTASGAKKPAPLVQPPRTDGLEHLPPIPDGHHRVLSSDGGIHDIPAENIEKARAIDPTMHVLNP